MAKQSKLTGAISLVIAQGVVLMLGYATHIIVPWLLGAGPYGIFGVVLSVQTILGLFLTLGIPSAVSRFVAQDEAHAQSILNRALRLQTLFAITLAGATLVAAPFIAYLLNDADLTKYIAFVSVIILLQAFFPVYVQFLGGMHRFNRQAALTSLYAVAKLAGAVGLIFVFGLFGAFAGFAVGGLVAAGVGWWWTRRLGGAKPKQLSLRAFLSFASTYVLILVGLQILMSLDLFMVKAFLQDDVAAGYYNAAVTLSRISYLLLQGLAFIILPSVSALTKPGASHDTAAVFIKDTLRYLIALIIPAVALAAATSEELLRLFFPDSFAVAAPILTVLMVGLGSLAFYLLLANIVAGAGKARVGLYITSSLVALSATLGYFLIPEYGAIGAAWQTTISSVIGLGLLSIYTFKTFSIPVPIKSMVNVIIASAVAVLPTYVWEVPALLLPLQYIVLLSLYVLVLAVLGEVTAQDKQRLVRIHPLFARLFPHKS